jgi:hypothetical protein
MVNSNPLFDAYSFRARLLPTLLVVLPIVAVIAILFPSIYATLSRTLGSIGVVAVGLFFLTQVIRTLGRQLEKRLYSEWGGIPTTTWLRHSDDNIDSITKARYHAFLEKHATGVHIPSPESEKNDPGGADGVYASAVKWLLEFARDTMKFPLVFSENVNYGFRRNTLAAKPLAITAVALLIALAGWMTYQQYGLRIEEISADAIALWAILILSIGLWSSLVTKAWVKDGAFAYARALLAACETAHSAQR